MPTGRPTKYKPTLVTEFCRRIASGRLTAEICRDEDMPSKDTIFRWLAKYPKFSDLYARAKELQAEELLVELMTVARTPLEAKRVKKLREMGGAGGAKRGDAKEKTLIEEVVADNVDARRLHVDTLKWALAKLQPRQYGQKVDVETSQDRLSEVLSVFRHAQENQAPEEETIQ
jgi:hypothetical protein